MNGHITQIGLYSKWRVTDDFNEEVSVRCVHNEQ